MMRNLAFCALLAGVCTHLTDATESQNSVAVTSACQDLWQHEPVLIFDVTGSTLGGPVHEHLTLYNDGFATYSNLSEFQGVSVIARTAQVSGEELSALLHALHSAGAFGLCDQPNFVTDVPLKTITVLRGAGSPFAHSFNYWLGVQQYAAADGLIRNFIQSHFAN